MVISYSEIHQAQRTQRTECKRRLTMVISLSLNRKHWEHASHHHFLFYSSLLSIFPRLGLSNKMTNEQKEWDMVMSSDTCHDAALLTLCMFKLVKTELRMLINFHRPAKTHDWLMHACWHNFTMNCFIYLFEIFFIFF